MDSKRQTDPAERFREAFARLESYFLDGDNLYSVSDPGTLIKEAREAALALVHTNHCRCGHIMFAHGEADECLELRDSLRGEKG